MAERRRRAIPLRWIIAGSFLTVFGVILLAGGGLLYAELQSLLWFTGLARMESHVHATLHDLGPLGNAEPRSLEGIRFQPMIVRPDFMAHASDLAEDLSGGIYRVEVLDRQGRIVARDSGPAEQPSVPDLTGLLKVTEGYLEGERSGVSLRLSYLERGDRQVLLIPLASEGHVIGFLQMTTTWHFGENVLNSFASFLAVGLLVIACVTVALAIRLARVLTEPLERLAEDGQLMAFKHPGFFQPMDTVRERDLLESLWASGQAPWKNWT